MEVHRAETRIGEHGELTLDNLPFEPGQVVEVVVQAVSAPSAGGGFRAAEMEEFRVTLDRLAELGKTLPATPSDAFRRESIYHRED